MNVMIRVTAGLWKRVHRDLDRPHPVAVERVGFLAARSAGLEHGDLLLIGYQYAPVEDRNYLPDKTVGARINSEAIRAAMQLALTEDTSVLHVHRHEHSGVPWFSRVDLGSVPQIAQSCANVRPHRAHGALVLSHDSASGLVWVPQFENAIRVSGIAIVGSPCVRIEGRV